MDSVPLNDLSRLTEAQRAEIVRAHAAVLSSGQFLNGPHIAGFAAELARFVGVRHVQPVGNGTDALELAIRALMPAGRNVVLTCANAGAYASVAARRAGFEVCFADIDPTTHCLDPERVRSVLSEQVGVVVVTHLYGRVCPLEEIRADARAVGARVLEDCAQSLGAATCEGRAGSLADASTFSFYPTKNLGALGDAGAVATQDDEVFDRVRTLHQYGWRGKYTIEVEGGQNSRMDELQAAVLRLRLPLLDDWNATRREIISQYAARAPRSVRVLPAEGPGHSGHLAVAETEHRSRFRAHLDQRRIHSDVHYPTPDHRQPAFAGAFARVSLPESERLSGRVVSLPVFPQLRADEIDRVGEALETFDS